METNCNRALWNGSFSMGEENQRTVQRHWFRTREKLMIYSMDILPAGCGVFRRPWTRDRSFPPIYYGRLYSIIARGSHPNACFSPEIQRCNQYLLLGEKVTGIPERFSRRAMISVCPGVHYPLLVENRGDFARTTQTWVINRTPNQVETLFTLLTRITVYKRCAQGLDDEEGSSFKQWGSEFSRLSAGTSLLDFRPGSRKDGFV